MPVTVTGPTKSDAIMAFFAACGCCGDPCTLCTEEPDTQFSASMVPNVIILCPEALTFPLFMSPFSDSEDPPAVCCYGWNNGGLELLDKINCSDVDGSTFGFAIWFDGGDCDYCTIPTGATFCGGPSYTPTCPTGGARTARWYALVAYQDVSAGVNIQGFAIASAVSYSPLMIAFSVPMYDLDCNLITTLEFTVYCTAP